MSLKDIPYWAWYASRRNRRRRQGVVTPPVDPPPPPVDGPAGLTHYWPLTETTGLRYDLVGDVDLEERGDSGVGSALVDGRVGAVFIAFEHEFLACAGTLLRFQSPFSFSFWARTDHCNDEFNFFSKDDVAGRELVVQSGTADDVIYPYVFTPATGSFGSSTAVPAETWFHIAVTFDGTRMEFYVNGVLDASEHDDGGPSYSDTEFQLGARFYGGNEGFLDGQMSDVRIWGRALGAAEVTAVFNL